MSAGLLQEFADRVGEIMSVIMREYFKQQTSQFHKMRITLPQFVVMDILNRNGESRMTDLARCINVSTAAMTGVVNRIVRDRYAIRINDPHDRRIVKVRLTAKGARAVENMIARKKEMTMKIFGAISEEEREEYLKILTHLKDNITGHSA